MVAAKQVLCVILFGAVHSVQTAFIHPGIIFTADQIETLRTNALSDDEPWASSYNALKANARASAAFEIQGGGALIGRNSGNDTITAWATAWQNDCYTAWLNSLMYAITMDDDHATTVANIVDAWSGTLTGVVENDNLATALSGRQLVNAAELVYYTRGSWPSGTSNFTRAQTMVSNVLVPNKDPVANPPTQPVVGGNQAALSHIAGMEFAIFTNNATGFQTELDILLLPKTACVGYEGSGLQALIQNKTGQCAEAGRDQGHSADEVGWLEEGARVAANQGNTALFDLESQDGSSTPLLMLGLEYYFKYNTGSDVSFDTTWGPCCCGTVLFSEISNKSRSTAYPIGEIAYNYYNTNKGLSMPYTELWLETNRPLKTSTNLGDFLVFPTLAWAASSL
ncbi:chondroitin AC/alginate lyase [Aspergillus similis]